MRRALVIAAALLAFLAAAYAVYWHVMASRAADWIAVWAQPAPGKAWHGRFVSAGTTGFPFDMDVRIDAPVVIWEGRAGHAVWQGPWLVASFRPWSLARFDIELPQEQTIVVDDGGSLRMIALQMASGLAHVEIEDNRARALSAELLDIVATVEQNRAPLAADRIQVEVEQVPGEEPAWDLFVQAEHLRFPAQAPEPFAAQIPLFATNLRIVGDVPDGAIRDRLAAWRDGGGTVEVLDLALDWPPLGVEGEGTMALDDELRPIGAFTARIVGYRELLEALSEVGRIEADEARVAGVALDAMAVRGEDDVRRLSVPVSVQNGRLYVGPIAVVDVPPVLPPEASF